MKNIAVIFGGQSSEHEISCLSAQTVIRNIDANEHNLVLIGITKDGRWLKTDSIESIADGSWKNAGKTAAILPDSKVHGIFVYGEDGACEHIHIDVAFPVLHGLFGEDGTIQGLLSMAGIPYVGCGVLSSAVCMDKVYTKIIVDTLGIAQARYVKADRRSIEDADAVCNEVEEKLGYPVFVKPSCAGSSCGVSQAHNRDELKEALKVAAREDRKILIEETIVGRELECAVFKHDETKASGVGEILSAETFYSYDAKYNNSESRTEVNVTLPDGKVEEIRRDAEKIFDAVDGYGLSRVDFFLEKDTNRVVFNEINTLPGFTSISMYPQLWEAAGIDNKKLVNMLIASAYDRE